MLQNTQTPFSSELTDEDLERYLLGRIQDRAELSQIESHLGGCPVCAERVQSMTGPIVTLIKALRQFESHGAGSVDYAIAPYWVGRCQ